jgi:chemotaxis protein CheZ
MAEAFPIAAELAERLAALQSRYPAVPVELVAETVQAILSTLRGDLSSREASLLHEVEELGQVIVHAKREIEALRVDEITHRQIPSATDELDAIVTHTAEATESILETCETLDKLAETLPEPFGGKLQEATTRIYEACSFQDITGQRINKVVQTLKRIEAKVSQIIATFGTEADLPPPPEPSSAPGDGLMNGPALPGAAMDQSDIDRLLASLE